MPNTSNYGFDYESPTSLPGTTLTGGPTSTMPILAVQVDSAIASLSTVVTEQATEIASLQASINTNQTSITNLTNWTRRGSVEMSFSSTNASTMIVNFGFTFPGVPTVVTNVDSGAGATARWETRAITINTTGFTLFAYQSQATAGTWVDIPVSWIAHYRA